MKKIKLNDFQREQLRKLRKDSGLSADQLSIDIGKSKGWYSQIENGRLQKISLDDLKIISDKIGVEVSNILGFEPELSLEMFSEEYDGKTINEIIAENIMLKKENAALRKKIEVAKMILD